MPKYHETPAKSLYAKEILGNLKDMLSNKKLK